MTFWEKLLFAMIAQSTVRDSTLYAFGHAQSRNFKNFMKQNDILTTLKYELSKNSLDGHRMLGFQMEGTKLERFLPKNQHTQRKSLNFENWCNGDVSKIEHHKRK